MAIDASQLTEYTWAQIATAAKQAMMTRAIGGAMVSIEGRSIGRASMDELKDLYNLAIEMIATDESADSGGGNALVRFGQP